MRTVNPSPNLNVRRAFLDSIDGAIETVQRQIDDLDIRKKKLLLQLEELNAYKAVSRKYSEDTNMDLGSTVPQKSEHSA